MIAKLTQSGSIRIRNEMDDEVVAVVTLHGQLALLDKEDRLELGAKIAEAMEG